MIQKALKHFKIRYRGRDEYVPLERATESWDELIMHCINQGYYVNEVTVLETPSKHLREPLTKYLHKCELFKQED